MPVPVEGGVPPPKKPKTQTYTPAPAGAGALPTGGGVASGPGSGPGSQVQRQLETSAGFGLDGYLSQVNPQLLAQLGVDLGLVYMGVDPHKYRNAARGPRLAANVSAFNQDLPGDRTMSYDQALNLIYTDPQMRKKIADKLIDAGLLDDQYTDEQLYTAWKQMVDRSKSLYAQNNKVTPFDVMTIAGGAPGSATGAGPQTITTRQINLTTPDAARSLLRRLISPWIGRQASEKEIDDFQAALNAAQQAHPSVTTTQYDARGNPVESRTHGGVVDEAFAQKYLEDTFGAQHEEYDTVARLMPAFYAAMESPI